MTEYVLAHEPEANPAAAAQSHVLVVDDELIVIEVTQTLLGRLGLSSSGVCSGPEALQWLSDGKPVDLIVLDLTMPHMNGRETLTEIQRLHPGLPVLLSSGYPETECEELLSENVSFLRKPYTAEEFSRAVCGVLEVELTMGR
ncbi:MAG: response regulator [Myxococcota bacterium]